MSEFEIHLTGWPAWFAWLAIGYGAARFYGEFVLPLFM